MKKLKLIQTVLKSGSLINIVWLPRDERIHLKSVITLKGDKAKRKWEVIWQYLTVKTEEPETVWNVGGLV